MIQNQPTCNPGLENTQPDMLHIAKTHLHNAKLWIYGSLLVVGSIQIVLRENFPQIRPPWPWIAGVLGVGLIGHHYSANYSSHENQEVIPPLSRLVWFSETLTE